MKFTAALSSLLLLLPVLVSAVAVPEPAAELVARQGRPGGRGGQRGGQGGQRGGQRGGAASSAAAAPSAAAKGADKGAANNAGGGAANSAAPPAASAAPPAAAAAAAGGDPQKSLTLDPKVVATGFESNGQQVPTAGQVASLTSNNNFINFCLTAGDKPITNGQQVKTGSCNPAPMGIIAATTNMPSSKFVNPKNGDTIAANTPFTITMAIKNLQAGNFVNAQSNYYSAPQQVNAQGNIIGHTHVVVEKLNALDQTTPTDPNVFAFFKGVNGAADAQGQVTADVTAGLPAGVYRLASINAAANHQPVLVAIAQHGSLDDMVYFTVSGNGAAAANATAAPPAAAAAAGGAKAAAGGAKAAAGGAKAAAGGAKGAAAPPAAAAAPPAAAKGANNAQAGNKGGRGGRGGRKNRVRFAREN